MSGIVEMVLAHLYSYTTLQNSVIYLLVALAIISTGITMTRWLRK
jgi:hypothetical protein